MVPRLEDLSGIQVAIWHAFDYYSEVKNDLKYFAANPRSLSYTPESVKIRSTWCDSFEKRTANSLLKFPACVRDKIPTSLVVLFTRDIVRWIKFHVQKFNLSSRFCFRFLKLGSFFTPKGINKELAARELINNTELSIHVRFCLACHYCFEEDIHVLWMQIPDGVKPRFHENEFHCNLSIYRRSGMVYFWCSQLLKQRQEGDSFPMMKFWAPFDLGSEVSLKNCWQKLSMSERRKAVKFSTDIFSEDRGTQLFSIDVLVYSDHLDTVKCLLFDVNNEDFFDCYNGYLLLYHFLNWPYQEYFMKSLCHVLNTLSKTEFYMLLHRIVGLMRHSFSCKLYDYRSIFREFWKKSSKSFKRVVFDHESNSVSIFRDYVPDDFDIGTSYYDELQFKNILLISELFNPESYSENNLCIIQLLLESLTEQQKSGIVKLQGESICVKAISAGGLGIANLFIECCVPKENSESYKRTLIHSPKGRLALWELIFIGNISRLDRIVNWALNSDEEIKELKENLLCLCPETRLFTTDKKKSIYGRLKLIFSPSNIREIKFNCAPDLMVLEEFKPFLLEGNFKKINDILQWSFSSENQILCYKKDLASKFLCNMDCFDPSKGFGEVDRLIEWCALSEEERKDLKLKFAFKEFVCKAYSDILLEFKFNNIDTFIRWSELSEKDAKQFKKSLVLYSSDIPALINEHLLKGKHEIVEGFFSWMELSNLDVKEFKEKMGTSLNLEKYFFVLKLKFQDIERVFNYIQLPEKEVNIIKKNFALKSDGIIGCIKQMKYDEVEEFVNWCFTSSKDCNWFRNKVFSRIGREISFELILGRRFNDVDIFLNWVQIHEFEKELLLKEIFYHENFFLMVEKVLVNSVEEFESILDIMSGWESLTEEWKESFLDFLRNRFKYKKSNWAFRFDDSNSYGSIIKPSLKDIMECSEIISKHIKREETGTNSKRSVNEIYVEESELSKSKRIKCEI